MGMWEEYCAICGGPLSLAMESKRVPLLRWLEQNRVAGVPGVVEYDAYGKFVKGGKVVAKVNKWIEDKVPLVKFVVHDQCFKLNGNKVPDRRYRSGLKKYQSQFFDFDDAEKDGVLWKVYDPRKNAENKKRILGILGKRCAKQTSKKYVGRPGPPYPAKECEDQKKKGNNGKMYVSRPTKTGVYRWVLAGSAKMDPKEMTVAQLKALCKEKGITGYSGLKKAELIKKCF
jgi:hypothetical protein